MTLEVAWSEDHINWDDPNAMYKPYNITVTLVSSLKGKYKKFDTIKMSHELEDRLQYEFDGDDNEISTSLVFGYPYVLEIRGDELWLINKEKFKPDTSKAWLAHLAR